MSNTKVVISGEDLYKRRGEVVVAIGALTRLQADWEGRFWLDKVGKPIWVWQWWLPMHQSSLTIDGTIALYEKQVGAGWTLGLTPLVAYRRGKSWIANDIRILKDMLLLIDMAGPDGEVHLSDYDCRYLDRALDLENTETKLKALI